MLDKPVDTGEYAHLVMPGSCVFVDDKVVMQIARIHLVEPTKVQVRSTPHNVVFQDIRGTAI
jgi:hypothetical protein